MRILLDSNVIISALAARGLCSAVFELCIENYELIISKDMIDEIAEVLKSKFAASESLIKELKGYISEFFIIIEDKNDIDICRDKGDNKILSAAVHNDVKYIITGDNDLLVLEEIEKIKIVTPRGFWEISKKADEN
jgi:putative PIN family toxin of toxin-antitoxin system